MAKTARGMATWRPELCCGQLRMEGCTADLGLPDLEPAAAAEAGARCMIVGVANVGGYIPDAWVGPIVEALEAGLDVASGLHRRLADVEEIRKTAERSGRRLYDVRHPTRAFPPGLGARRSGKRVLTVGTDCAVGKMYTALAVEREMKRRGMKADFRATGQTGILIAGSGVSVDAVVADFVSGAAEWLSPANDEDHWDVIEGQGTLFHPAYAGVTLALVHGSQPDALVICHRAGRERLHGLESYPAPGLAECAERHVEAARLTNPEALAVGASIDTSALEPEKAARLLAVLADELGVPCVDPLRTGVGGIVDRLESL